MDSYDFYQLEPEEPRRSRAKTAVYLGIVLLLIIGLLWSGISGAVWLVDQMNTEAETAVTAIPPLSTAAPLPTPNPAHAVNRIAFVNAGGQVETIAPDGSDRRQISDESFPFQFPTWSPTDEYVAAIGGRTVYRLADSLDVEARPLYASRSQNPFYLYWSPNGRFLTILANHPSGMGLHLAPVDGGEDDSRLLEMGSPFYWDWTADSSQILMHTGFSGDEARLALLDVESGRGGPNAALPGLFQAPDISANGRYWAYAELDDNGLSWLVAADADTGAMQRQRHAGQVALSWSPAADQLAFISGGEGRLDFAGPLRLMDAATGETRLLSQGTVLAFFWSPDGRYLAAITGKGELGNDVIAAGNTRDERQSEVTSRSSRHLGKSARQHPTITLNLILIDAASGESRHLTAFEPTLTFITQFLPFFDQYALSHRVWSPASDALVLPVQRDGENTIVIIPIDGGSPRVLGAGDMPFWSQH